MATRHLVFWPRAKPRSVRATAGGHCRSASAARTSPRPSSATTPRVFMLIVKIRSDIHWERCASRINFWSSYFSLLPVVAYIPIVQLIQARGNYLLLSSCCYRCGCCCCCRSRWTDINARVPLTSSWYKTQPSLYITTRLFYPRSLFLLLFSLFLCPF